MKFQFQKTKISAFLASLKIPANQQKEQTHPEAEMTESAVLELEESDDDQCETDSAWLAEMLATDIDRENSSPVFDGDVRKEQSLLVKTIGARLREARELTNVTQSTAAKRLGYQNSSKLNRVELASDGQSVPIWLIVRAAKLYDVSVDFLFGLTEDFDSTAHRPTGSWLVNTWEQSRLRDLELIGKLHSEVRLVSRHIPAVVELAKELDRAVGSFRQSNPEFDEMRSSARVVGSVERLMSATNAALGELRRLDRKIGLPAR